jgi:signal transduction histidine kinase
MGRARMTAGVSAREQRAQREERDDLDPCGSRPSGPGALALVVELAHDLRSPLTSILALSEVLMRGGSGDVNDLQRQQLGLVYQAALGLTAVTNDVIELAKGGSRLSEDDAAPFSIGEVFTSVADIIRPIADEKGVAVRLLAPVDDRRVGHGPALRRVVLNLATNALKFTDAGYVEITAAPSGDRRLSFSVRDTGRGIAPPELEAMVRSFRPSQVQDQYLLGGTGLGLAICQKLLRAMGSELEVETWPGEGTRFHFGLEMPTVRLQVASADRGRPALPGTRGTRLTPDRPSWRC